MCIRLFFLASKHSDELTFPIEQIEGIKQGKADKLPMKIRKITVLEHCCNVIFLI